jgi:hypothetical protein
MRQRDPLVSVIHEALDALQEAVREIAEAMTVLAPNMPSSGLVDACKQVKQAAISEANNSTKLEADLHHAHEARERLRAYVQHTSLCQAGPMNVIWPEPYRRNAVCTCGLDAALAREPVKET